MSTEPTIVAAALAAGHDGLAEVAVEVCYPNGATRTLTLPYDAVADALDASSVTSLAELIGRPWTILVAPPTSHHPHHRFEGAS